MATLRGPIRFKTMSFYRTGRKSRAFCIKSRAAFKKKTLFVCVFFCIKSWGWTCSQETAPTAEHQT